MFHSVRGQYGNKFEQVHEKSSFPKKIALTILRKASKVKHSPGIRKTPETIQISEALVRETGLEVGDGCK
jgi:hypothetical protein